MQDEKMALVGGIGEAGCPCHKGQWVIGVHVIANGTKELIAVSPPMATGQEAEQRCDEYTKSIARELFESAGMNYDKDVTVIRQIHDTKEAIRAEREMLANQRGLN